MTRGVEADWGEEGRGSLHNSEDEDIINSMIKKPVPSLRKRMSKNQNFNSKDR